MSDVILMAHGGGGRLSDQLFSDAILPALSNPILDRLDDGATLNLASSEVVVTTDSYVVTPLRFAGGDIGVLAASGTINDLVMQGARPEALTCGLIIEEGLRIEELRSYVESLARTAASIGVSVVTGDTKVVERGGDFGLFINTAGIGTTCADGEPGIANGEPGDSVIVTGTIADHGIAILNERNDLGLVSAIASDVAPLWGMFEPLFASRLPLHCLRDPTRGGVASAVCHLAEASQVGVVLDEDAIPMNSAVHGACEILGLDPLTVANEGKAIVVCPGDVAEDVLACLRSHPLGEHAVEIGKLVPEHPGTVVLKTRIGGQRIVSRPSGHQLPRIC